MNIQTNSKSDLTTNNMTTLQGQQNVLQTINKSAIIYTYTNSNTDVNQIILYFKDGTNKNISFVDSKRYIINFIKEANIVEVRQLVLEEKTTYTNVDYITINQTRTISKFYFWGGALC